PGAGTSRVANGGVWNWTDTPNPPQVVQPSGGNYKDAATSNNGFYVVGPKTTAFPAMADPGFTVTFRASQMTFTIPVDQLTFRTETAGTNPAIQPLPTILLQRLACPGLPYQNNPAMALYNPYITVDYLEHDPAVANMENQVNEGRTYNKT